MPLIPILTIAGSGILGGVSAQVEANNLRKQVKEQNKMLTQSANNLSALEGKEAAASQMAYNWAASMIRKNRDRPEALAAISQNLNQGLGQNADRTSQYRAAASSLLAQRAVPPSANMAWLTGAVKGLTSGAGLVSVADKNSMFAWNPDNKYPKRNPDNKYPKVF